MESKFQKSLKAGARMHAKGQQSATPKPEGKPAAKRPVKERLAAKLRGKVPGSDSAGAGAVVDSRARGERLRKAAEEGKALPSYAKEVAREFFDKKSDKRGKR